MPGTRATGSPVRRYQAYEDTYATPGDFGKKPLRNRYLSAMQRTADYGGTAEDEYMERAMDYDPYEAAERSARAQFETFREDLNQDIGDLRGQQVGMGRLDTGFATEDEDRLVTAGVRNLNQAVASRSMQAAGLDLSNIEGIGRQGSEYGNRYLELVSGGLDRVTADENMKRKKKAGLFGAIGGALGGIGGFLAGGPAGAAAGARIGSGVGRGIGG